MDQAGPEVPLESGSSRSNLWTGLPPDPATFQLAGVLRRDEDHCDFDVTIGLRQYQGSSGFNGLVLNDFTDPIHVSIPGVRVQVPTISDVKGMLSPDPLPALTPFISDSLMFRGYWDSTTRRSTRRIRVVFDPHLRQGPDIAVAARVEVFHGDELVATASFLDRDDDDDPNAELEGRGKLVGDIDRIQHFDENDPAWIVRVTGDPVNSLRCHSCKRYWSGTFQLPLSEIRRRTAPQSNFRPRKIE